MVRRLIAYSNTQILRVLPHHLLSRLIERATRIRVRAVKNAMIRLFVRAYRVNMEAALKPAPSDYPDFNTFFTRGLKPDARPLVSGPREIAIPVDGTVNQCGTAEGTRLLQAKGIDYSLPALLGSRDLAAQFAGGSFATLYLAPFDYHRIHMPLDGTLLETRYIPGRLFSVNDASTRLIPGLFTRNERLVTLFDSTAGPMALVLVGAFFVSGIETVWAGAAGHAARPRHTDYRDQPQPIRLARGAELGRFNMGSTVIVLFTRDRVRLAPQLRPQQHIRMGELLGWMA